MSTGHISYSHHICVDNSEFNINFPRILIVLMLENKFYPLCSNVAL